MKKDEQPDTLAAIDNYPVQRAESVTSYIRYISACFIKAWLRVII